nr:hypothetical protein [Noviherbaspirillum suwonense]
MEAIARLAATIVKDGDTLILDTGTTTATLATQLVRRHGLHVITNNLMVLPLFADEEEIAVTVIGGE